MKITITTIIVLFSLALSGCALNKQADQVEQVSDGGDTKVAVSADAGDTDTQIDTSDWKVYENEEYGFSFRYRDSWRILQEFDVSDSNSGNMYQIVLRNDELQSIIIFLTSEDFVPGEWEGSPTYISGEPLTFDKPIAEQLREKQIIFHKVISQKNESIVFFNIQEYVNTSLGAMSIFQNVNKKLPYVTMQVFLKNVDSEENISLIADRYINNNAVNQKLYDDFIFISASIDY